MIAYWDALQKRHDELLQLLADHSLDRQKRQLYQKERNHLATVLAKQKEIIKLEKELIQAKEHAREIRDEEMAAMFVQEAAELEGRIRICKNELDTLLVPPSEHDDRSVFVEIRAGAGGQEAALFAGDLLKMYTNYALQKGWRVSVESVASTDLGGYREIIAYIKGHDVYGHLKRESGVHRVQTSSCNRNVRPRSYVNGNGSRSS